MAEQWLYTVKAPQVKLTALLYPRGWNNIKTRLLLLDMYAKSISMLLFVVAAWGVQLLINDAVVAGNKTGKYKTLDHSAIESVLGVSLKWMSIHSSMLMATESFPCKGTENVDTRSILALKSLPKLV